MKNKKALAFLLSDSKTDCSTCNAKTIETIKKSDSHSVVVFIDQIDPAKWHQVSPVVPTAMYDAKLGNIIPKAVITSPEMLQVIAAMSEDDMEKNSNYSEAKKTFRISSMEWPLSELKRISAIAGPQPATAFISEPLKA